MFWRIFSASKYRTGKTIIRFSFQSQQFCLWSILPVLFVCLIWFFRSHQQSFSYIGTGLPRLNQYWAQINVLAQGHNAVTLVRLEPVAPRSQVKHPTTALPYSTCDKLIICWRIFQIILDQTAPAGAVWFGTILFAHTFPVLSNLVLVLRVKEACPIIQSGWMSLIWFFTFHQQFFSYVGMGLPGLNQY